MDRALYYIQMVQIYYATQCNATITKSCRNAWEKVDEHGCKELIESISASGAVLTVTLKVKLKYQDEQKLMISIMYIRMQFSSFTFFVICTRFNV